jgi:hypothetical protein
MLMGVSLMAQFSKEFLRRTLIDDTEARIIEDTIVDHRRWVVVHSVVFKYNERHYMVCYDAPATECQDVRPFENEPDIVEVPEVKPVMVEQRKWVRVHGPSEPSLKKQ